MMPVDCKLGCRDLAAIKDAEAQLRRSREHLALAQKVGKIGSDEVDLRTLDAYWSDGLFALLGLDPAETPAVFESFLAVLHPDDRRIAREARERELRGVRTDPMELRIVRPDGEVRWLQRQVEIVRDDGGEPSGLVATYQDITEFVTTQEALRESREHLAQAQAVGRIGSVKIGIASGKSNWSDELYRILGYEPQSTPANYANFEASVHPDDRAKVNQSRLRSRRGENAPPAEYRIVRQDGEVRWLERHARIVRDDQGSPTEITLTLQDVTERRRIQDELRHSREHLERAQSLGLIGSSELSLHSGKSLWTKQYFSLLGLDCATTEPGFMAFRNAILPEDRSKLISLDAILAHRGQIEPIEIRVRCGNGEVRWLRRQIEVIRQTDGTPISVLFTLQDISERKQFEEERRKTLDHLLRAQRIGQVGSFEYDCVTGAARWSDEFYRILGLDPASTAAALDTLYAMVHPDDRAFTEIARARLARGEVDEPRLFRIVRPNGEVRWLHRQMEAVEGEAGTASKVVSTYKDVTDLKKVEADRAELERQLAQVQRLDAVGQLTGGVAHDFNNLLSVLLGRLHMIEEDVQVRLATRDSVRACIKAVNRGTTLTRSLLAFSRAQQLAPVVLDMRAAVTEMVDMLRPALGETVSIVGQAAPDLWKCEADEGQLQHALLNLALNARDAMPGGGALTIEARNTCLESEFCVRWADVVPGDYVELCVTDNGVGMPPDVVERAFEPFFTTKGVGKGSGLGLSMVYGFAKQSGGHVVIESEVGQGTCVHLYLPRVKTVRSGNQSAPTLPSTSTGMPRPVAAGRLILLVEDDADVRELTRLQLERLGYSVLAAGDGAEALRLLRDHPETALLLTDVLLPGGTNGPRLAEKAAVISKALPVVFMSGYAGPEPLDVPAQLVPLRLLQKPFELDELGTQLQAALDRNAARPVVVGESRTPAAIP